MGYYSDIRFLVPLEEGFDASAEESSWRVNSAADSDPCDRCVGGCSDQEMNQCLGGTRE